MPAYYQTGTATSTDTMLSLMNTFLVNTLGWTLEQHNPEERNGNSTSDSLKYNTYYYTVNGGHYFISTGFEGATIDYRTYIRGGVLKAEKDTPDPPGTPPLFNSASQPIYAFPDQDGYLYNGRMDGATGPYTKYHLFGGQEGVNGNYCYLVLETSSGLFTHFGIGELDRIGDLPVRFCVGLAWNYTTAQQRSLTSTYHQRMFDSHMSNNSGHGGAIYYDRDSLPHPAAQAWRFGNSILSSAAGEAIGGMTSALMTDGPNAMNGRTVLLPNHIRGWDGDSWYRILGVAPAFRSVRINNLQPEDVVDTDWMVFPIIAKNAATGPTSGNYGWAYKFQ